MKKKSLIRVLVIVLILLQAIILAIVAFRNLPNYDPNNPKKLFGQKIDRLMRLGFFNEYNFERLKNPITGEIPIGINQKVLEFVSKIPSSEDYYKISINQMNKMDFASGIFNWKNIGPQNVGGRMNCVAYDITNPKNIIAGAASGGIWKSSDNGASWSKKFPLNDNHTIYCLAQDSRSGKTSIWYAGSGELLSTIDRKVSTMARMSYLGNGIYKSTDNGESWFLLQSTQSKVVGTFLSPFQGIWNIVVEPSITDQDIIYVACIGAIMRSTDGGKSWKQVLGDKKNISFSTDIVRSTDGKLFAAFSRISLDGAKPSTTGIFMSTDKGINWQNITPKGFTDSSKVIKLAVAPSNPNILYVFADAPINNLDPHSFPDSKQYLWKCTFQNSEPTWVDLSQSLFPKNQEIMKPATLGGYAMCISVKPDNPDFVLLGGTSLYRSTNGFANNQNVSMIGGYYWDPNIQSFNYELSSEYLHPDVHGFAFNPTNPKAICVASDGGIHYCQDIEFIEPTWKSLNIGLTTSQFYSIAIGKNQDYQNYVVGGLQDNGSFFTPKQGEIQNWKELTGADGMHTYVNGNYNFALTSWYNGATVYIKLDPITKEPINYWFIRPNKAPSSKFAFYNRFIVDPNNPNTIYLPALNSLYYNHQLMLCETDQKSFQAKWNINPPTPFVFAQNEVITALEMPKSIENTLYVGTRFGKVYRITNANKEANAIREEITSNLFPKNGWISCIEYDDENGILLVSFSNYEVVSIFASFDDGLTWQAVAGNLEENPDGSGSGPSVRWIESVLIDDKVYYFAATDAGLFSTDKLNGEKTIWLQEGKNTIGNVICEMIDAYDNNKIVVATQGNGVWVSDLSKVSVSNIDDTDIQIYPNPTNNYVNLTLSQLTNTNYIVSIYTYSGDLKFIKQYNLNMIKNNNIQIDISHLESGLYILTLKTNDMIKITKLIKN